jgi:hypothetical protein
MYMKLKQKLLTLVLAISLFGLLLPPVTASAAISTCNGVSLKKGQSCCGGVVTTVISCDQPGGTKAKLENTGLWGILLLLLNIVSAGVIIAAIGGVAYGSIIYTTAGGNLDKVKKSRAIIANTVVGIAVYILLYAFMNYLIPGGIFKP